ncbi:MAG: VWA domain-containing protein [Candidatus Hydrogenedentota bacterium]
MNNEYIPTEEDLTAYALGEADDAQKKLIEEAIAVQPVTKALLDEIRGTIELSEATFAGLKAEELSEKQRASVEAAVATVIPMPRKNNWLRVVSYAATVALMAGIGYAVLTPELVRYSPEFRHDSPQELMAQRQSASTKQTISTEGEKSQLKPGDEGLYRYREAKDDETNRADADNKGTGTRTLIAAKPITSERPVVLGETPSTIVTFFAEPSAEHAPANVSITPGQTEQIVIAGGKKNEVDQFGFVQNQPGNPVPASKASVRIASRTLGNDEIDKLQSLGYLEDDLDARINEVQQQYVDQIQDPFQKTKKRLELQKMQGGRFQVAGSPSVQEQWRFEPRPIQPVVTPGTEAYERIIENKFKQVSQDPLSTFSIDVDTASYANVRRFLNQSQLPPVDAVRIEELINYFDYDYPQPIGEDPFSATIEVAQAPWNAQHKLVRVGLKGKDIVAEERPATNLVFLLDVSGSMNNPNKLPLLKQSLRLLTEQLTENDRVAIAVYAGKSGLVLPSTPGNMQNEIIDALNRLSAGGSTNGGAGIQLAYDVASQNFIQGGVNRVILATDGDFNVGTTSREALVNMIEQKAKSGVFLSVLGFGMGNLKDATMEKLADKGNGNYAYIDTFSEAKKVLVDEMSGTLFTIAKDVKIQVEFNPSKVQAYRLIGYENRALANRDFNDDTKDAGEIGAGHTVTALYEIVPTGVTMSTRAGVDELRYQKTAPVETQPVNASVNSEVSSELLTVKLRYKQPDGQTSKLLAFPVEDVNSGYNGASTDFKFASAVAAFGMKLRNSPFAASMNYDTVLSLAEGGVGPDLNGYRSEFLSLVRQARSLSPQPVPMRYQEPISR